MKTKLSILAISAVLTCVSFFSFAAEAEGTTKKCDSSTTSRCVITGVGEGTGQLIVEQAN